MTTEMEKMTDKREISAQKRAITMENKNIENYRTTIAQLQKDLTNLNAQYTTRLEEQALQEKIDAQLKVTDRLLEALSASYDK
jgi:predicted  nucleic acid-binding Zn-ribbon protein